MKTVLLNVALFAVAIGGTIYVVRVAAPASTERAFSVISTGATPRQLDRLVNDWLEDQRRGRSGSKHWLDPAQAQTLFAVRSWEIVDRLTDGRTVRIESSNRVGAPIVALWEIEFRDGKIDSVFQK